MVCEQCLAVFSNHKVFSWKATVGALLRLKAKSDSGSTQHNAAFTYEYNKKSIKDSSLNLTVSLLDFEQGLK